MKLDEGVGREEEEEDGGIVPMISRARVCVCASHTTCLFFLIHHARRKKTKRIYEKKVQYHTFLNPYIIYSLQISSCIRRKVHYIH